MIAGLIKETNVTFNNTNDMFLQSPKVSRARGWVVLIVLSLTFPGKLLPGTETPSPTGFLKEANAAFASERYEDALKNYKFVLAIDPANGAAKKGIKRCENRLQKVIRTTRGQEREILHSAFRELKKGNVVEAQDLVLDVLNRTPNHADGLRFLAEIRARAQRDRRVATPAEAPEAEGALAYLDGRYQAAVRWWEKARSLSPGRPELDRKISLAQRRLAPPPGGGAPSSAIDISSAGTADVEALLKEGKALLEDRRYEPAIKKFEQLLLVDPRHPEAARCVALGRETAAQIAFTAGTQAARNGDLDQAENLLDSAVKHKPEFPEALEKLNWVREENRQRKIERAEKLYRQALGAALSGDAEKAKDLGRVASELNPDNEEMRRFLDRLNHPGRAH